MNLNDLVKAGSRAVLDKTGDVIPQQKLQIALSRIFEVIKTASLDEDITIKGFGKFTKKEVKGKTIENQFTKNLPQGKVDVEDHLVPKFKPSKSYKSLLRYTQ